MSGPHRYRSLLASGSLVTLGNAAAAGLGLVLLLIFARTVTPAELALLVGLIAVIDGGQMLLDAMVNTGMINLASRDGRDGKPDAALLRAGFWSKLILGLAFAGLVALSARPLSHAMFGDGSVVGLLVLAGGAAAVAGMAGFVQAVLAANEAFARLALVSSWKNLLRLVAVAPFLLGATADAHGAALAICAVTLVTLAASAMMIPWTFLRADAPLWQGVTKLLGVNGWMTLAALAMFGGRLDVWLVGYLSSAQQAGLYAVAAQLCVGVGIVTQALVTTLLPTVSRFGSQGEAGDFLRRSTRNLMPLWILPLLAWLLAAPVIGWAFGRDYAAAAPIFVWLFSAGIMTLFTAPLMLVLMSIGRARILAMGSLAQLLLRVVLAVPLVPANGAVGLAWADVLSRLIAMSIIAGVILRVLRQPALTPGPHPRPTAEPPATNPSALTG